MNKITQNILNILIVVGITLIVIISGLIVLNNFKDSITVMEGICNDLGGELVSYNCSDYCTPSCQYPNGTEINITREIELINWSR